MMVAENVSQGATEMVVNTQPVVLLLSETCHFYSSRLNSHYQKHCSIGSALIFVGWIRIQIQSKNDPQKKVKNVRISKISGKLIVKL
jgi:hypothetical protein